MVRVRETVLVRRMVHTHQRTWAFSIIGWIVHIRETVLFWRMVHTYQRTWAFSIMGEPRRVHSSIVVRRQFSIVVSKWVQYFLKI